MPRQFRFTAIINVEQICSGTHTCREAAACTVRNSYRDLLQSRRTDVVGYIPNYRNDPFSYIAAYHETVPINMQLVTEFTCNTPAGEFTPYLNEIAAIYPNTAYSITERPKQGLQDRTVALTITGDYQTMLCWWWMTIAMRIAISHRANNVLGLLKAADQEDQTYWYMRIDKGNTIAAWPNTAQYANLGAASFWMALGPVSITSNVITMNTARAILAQRREVYENTAALREQQLKALHKVRGIERDRQLATARSRLTAKLEL